MMRNVLISILKDLNENVTDNPEYLRGQLEMILALLGYEDDGLYEGLSILRESFPESTLTERKRIAG